MIFVIPQTLLHFEYLQIYKSVVYTRQLKAISNLNMEFGKISILHVFSQIHYLLKIFCAIHYNYTQPIPLVLNNSRLSQVKVTKFLSVTVDKNLTWKNHIDELVTKIQMYQGILV